MGRIKHIDVARGLGMLLVVVGHVRLIADYPGEVFEAIFAFHVPFFFLLSGAFFSPEGELKEVVSQRTKALLLPYGATSALGLMDEVLLDGADLLTFLLGVIYGTGSTVHWIPLWFLPNLWLVTLLALPLCRQARIGKWRWPLQCAFLIGCLILGVMLMGVPWQLAPVSDPDNRAGLPLSADLVPITLAWFLIGYLARNAIRNFTPNTALVLVALGVFVAVRLLSDFTMDLNYRRYDHLLLTTVAACAGIYLTLAFSHAAGRVQALARPFSYFGAASLIVLIFHIAPGDKVYFAMRERWPERALEAGLVSFLIMMAVPVFVYETMKRVPLLMSLYFPTRAESGVLNGGTPAAAKEG